MGAEPTVEVPLGLLTDLADQYLRGTCPIKGGWGESEVIQQLIDFVPVPQAVSALLSDEMWEVTIWVGSNYIKGPVDRADRERLVVQITAALGEVSGN